MTALVAKVKTVTTPNSNPAIGEAVGLLTVAEMDANINNLATGVDASYAKVGGAITGDMTLSGTLGVTGATTLGALSAGVTTVTSINGITTTDIALESGANTFSAINTFSALSLLTGGSATKPVTASGTNTYTATLAGLTLTDGYMVDVTFSATNTSATVTIAFNGSGTATPIRAYTGASGFNCAIGALRGTQRLRYESSSTCWIAVDVRDIDMSTYSSGNIALPVGYTAHYTGTSGKSLDLSQALQANAHYEGTLRADCASATIIGLGRNTPIASSVDMAGRYINVTSGAAAENDFTSSIFAFANTGESLKCNFSITGMGSVHYINTNTITYDGTNTFNANYGGKTTNLLSSLSIGTLASINATTYAGASFTYFYVTLKRIA